VTTVAPRPAPPYAAASVPRVEDPYVGLRPYGEQERDLFFGRAQDAVRLCNKVFAGPLTVLYAPSGVGKTSLLKTLLVPDLRAQEAFVVYFDAWQDDPCGALKVAILAQAAAEGSPAAVTAGESLARVAEVVSTGTGKSLVLVLDQFEAFLIQHARCVDPLREELAALARSEADAHVVLSLREEFLAALDVFRERIATLFRSTYRLLPLMQDGARAAITQPAELLAGRYDPRLVDALLEDLRSTSRSDGDPAAAHGGGVDLPFLQIVCLRLWRDAVARGTRELTLESYERLGLCAGIIKHYVDGVVSALSPRQRRDMAKLLDLLAPRSGTKMSYAVQDLRERTGISDERVTTVLRHLYENWVLRTRQTGAANTYELYHDTFIAILRPWIDDELGRANRRRWALQSAAIGLAAALLVLLPVWLMRQSFERAQTSNKMEKAERELSAALTRNDSLHRGEQVTAWVDEVARYLVGKGDPRSLAALERLLGGHQRLVARGYARPEAVGIGDVAARGGAGYVRGARSSARGGDAAGAIAETGGSGAAPPLTLTFGSDSGVAADSVALQREWSVIAAQLIDSLGLPAPLMLATRTDGTLPADSVRLVVSVGDRTATASLPVLWHDDSVLVAADSLPPGVRSFFFQTRRAGWRRLPAGLADSSSDTSAWSPSAGRSWWVVPRWTLPIWRASGQSLPSPGQLVALATAQVLMNRPELLLSPDATRYLLARARIVAPGTVDEAVTIRGETGIRQVFIAVARKRRPLSSLAAILDVAADYPGESPERVATRLALTPGLQLQSSQAAAAGRAGYSTPASLAATFTLSPVYPPADSAAAFRQVRVHLGDSLVRRLVYEGRRELRPELLRALEDMRAETFRRFGIEAPSVQFYEDDALAPDAYRVELLTETHDDTGTGARTARLDSALADVVAALHPRIVAARAHWVTADAATYLTASLSPGLGRWVRARFPPHQLKLTLRAVIGPAAAGQADRDATLAHSPWLLGSLVFWDAAGGVDDPRATALLLRRTQRARLDSENAASPSGAAARLVARGIAELEADRVQPASAAFRSATSLDRPAAVAAFLTLYAQRAAPMQAARLTQACKLPAPGAVAADSQRLEDSRRSELEEALARPLRSRDDVAWRRHLGECLLRGLVVDGRFERAGALFDGMVAEAAGAPWPPQDGYRAAYWALREPELGRNAGRLRTARALLLDAVARGTGQAGFNDILGYELVGTCDGRTAVRGCYEMLDTLAARNPSSFHLPYAFGVSRAWAEGREDALQALRLLRRAWERLPAAGVDAPVARAQVRVARARANLALVRHGDTARAAAAVADLREVLANYPTLAYGRPEPADVYGTLIDVYVARGRLEDATGVLAEASRVLPDSSLWATNYFVALAGGKLDSARTVADAMLSADSTNGPALWYASTYRLLAGDPGAVRVASHFLDETREEYRDYIRLILYWSLRTRGEHARAAALLDERWKEIDPRTWPDRLSQGDRAVWREMLVGYYGGHVRRSAIFDPLADDGRFASSPLSKTGFSLAGARCEAHFYDGLLQGVTGLPWTRHWRQRSAFDAAIATQYYSYYEYHMANLLRERQDRQRR
jgi:conflict system STAND superfamily ATPase